MLVSKVDKSQEENFDEQNIVEGEILESWPDKKESKKESKEGSKEGLKNSKFETSESDEKDQESLEDSNSDSEDSDNSKGSYKNSDKDDDKSDDAENPEDDSSENPETYEDDSDLDDSEEEKTSKTTDIEKIIKKKNEKKKESNVWQYFWYTLIFLIITAVLLVQFNASKNSENKALALVNGEKLTQADFDTEYNKLDNFTKAAVSKEQVLEFLIKRKILLQEVKAQGITNENEQEALQELIEKAVSNINISQREVEDYYNANIQQFNVSDSVRAQHILLCYNESTSCNVNATEEQVKLNVGRLIRLIQKGESFESLALNYSNDPSVQENKGDLGYMARGQTVPEFETLIFSLKIGEVSFTKTIYGYHIVKKLDEIKSGFVPLESIQDRIAESLLLQKKQEAADKYIEDLYEKAEIVRYDEKKE